jgi:hypothetical protein
MYEDLLPALLKVHREVFLPEFTRIVANAFEGLGKDLDEGFARIHHQIDRLETQAHAALAVLKRIEATFDRIELKLDRIEERLD